MALVYSKIDFTIIEVDLKNKPPEMLALSPKNTVPILKISPEAILDESLDIMRWALQKSDQDEWLPTKSNEQELTDKLISRNDNYFKQHLDRFKYPNRYPREEIKKLNAQTEVKNFFTSINDLLETSRFLTADRITIADVAIFPFIRQAINIDKTWFNNLNLHYLRLWFDDFSQSLLFHQVMKKIAN